MITNVSPVYDPQEFAEWLTKAFEDSPFKSWQQVADRVNTTRSTLSRLAGAKPQSLNGKPGQPDPDLVIRLATIFGRDVDEALMMGGHAPLNRSIMTGKPQNAAEFVERLKNMGFEIQTDFDYDQLGPDDLQDIIDDIEAKLIFKTSRRKR